MRFAIPSIGLFAMIFVLVLGRGFLPTGRVRLREDNVSTQTSWTFIGRLSARMEYPASIEVLFLTSSVSLSTEDCSKSMLMFDI